MLEEILESGRSQVLFLLCILLPVGVTAATSKLESTVQEFRVYRVAQLDFQGQAMGSRAWRVSHEAVALGAKTQIRRCLIVWWKDLAKAKDLNSILHPALGSVLILLPKSLAHFTQGDRLAFAELEGRLMGSAWPIPIYMAFRTPSLAGILEGVSQGGGQAQSSAVAALWAGLTANAFQLVSANPATSITIAKPLYNLVGRLSALERGGNVPTVAIVAHYDAGGVAPGLSESAEANGSGVAAALELLRLFHRLYASPKTRPRYNLLFLFSAGGHFNFQGTRSWIESHLEAEEADLELALCLDSLGGGRQLYAHVSKEPKPENPVARLHAALAGAAEARETSLPMLTKKISLANPKLAWEHERFNIRKLRALTLSRQQEPQRGSLLDTLDLVDTKALAAHVEIIAEGLVRFLYRLGPEESGSGLLGSSGVSWAFLSSWLARLGESGERSSPVLAEAGKDGRLLSELYSAVEAHSHSTELKPVAVHPKEPEFLLYGAVADTMSVHRVKPAVFDLFLASLIAAYLGIFYAAVTQASTILPPLLAFFNPYKSKAH